MTNSKTKNAPGPASARGENETGHDIKGLSVKEAAETIGISERMLNKFIATGELRSALIGRRRLVNKADLKAFFDSRAKGGAQ